MLILRMTVDLTLKAMRTGQSLSEDIIRQEEDSDDVHEHVNWQ